MGSWKSAGPSHRGGAPLAVFTSPCHFGAGSAAPVHRRHAAIRHTETRPTGAWSDLRAAAIRFLSDRENLALFLLALLFRALYLLSYRESPFWGLLYGDPGLYHKRALEILEGEWLGRGVSFHSAPLYPYLLAAVYRLFGPSIPAVFAIQSIIGAVDVVVAATCARLAFGRGAFRLAGICLAGWPILAYFNAELLEITFVLAAVHAMLLLLVWLRRREQRRESSPAAFHAAAGLLLGVAVLGKPNVVLFLPAWFLLEARIWSRNRRWATAARRAGAMAAGLACAVLPFTMRNLAVHQDLVLTSANGGINLYIGNNPAARGVFWVPAALQGDLYENSRRQAENPLGRELKASEVSSYWQRRAIAWIAAEPGAALRLAGRKLLLLWNRLEIGNHFDPNFIARDVPLLRYSPWRFAVVVPFAWWGIAVVVGSLRRSRGGRPHLEERGAAASGGACNDQGASVLLLWLGVYLLSLLPFFVAARYRLPAVPTMVMFGAAGALDLWRRIRALREPGQDRRQNAGVLLAGLAVTAAAAVVVFLPLERPESFFFNQHQILASAARDRGDSEEAIRQYREAVRLEPRSVLGRNSLGVAFGKAGNLAEAEAELREAIRLDEGYPPAWRNLGGVLRRRGDAAGACEALRRALDLDPRFRGARADLVQCLLEVGAYESADAELVTLLRQDPADAQSLWNRAVLLGRYLGRPGEAGQALDRLEALTGGDARTRELREALGPN